MEFTNTVKRFSLSAAVLLLTAVIISSCGKAPEKFTRIPADATVVFALDHNSLSSKITMEEMKELSFYQMLETQLSTVKPELHTMFQNMLNDISSTGLSKEERVLFYQSGEYMHLYASLVDKAKFEEMIKTFYNGPIEEKSGYQYIDLNKGFIAYNDNELLVAFSPGHPSEKLADHFENLIGLSSDQTLAENTNFTEFYEQTFDIGFWLNGTQTLKMVEQYAGAEVGKMMPTEAYVNVGLNFNKGEVAVTGNYSLKDSEGNDMKILGDNIDTELISSFPAYEYLMMFGLKFNLDYIMNMKAVKPLMKEMEKAPMFQRMEPSDIISGDMVFAIKGLKLVKKTIEVDGGEDIVYTEELPEFVVAMKTGEGDSFKKVFQLLESALEKEGDYYKIPADEMGELYFYKKDRYIYLTSEKDGMEQIVNGKEGSSRSLEKAVELAGEYPAIGIFNPQAFDTELLVEMDVELGYISMIEDILGNFGLVTSAGSNTKSIAKAELTNKDENSLLTIMKLIDKAGTRYFMFNEN